MTTPQVSRSALVPRTKKDIDAKTALRAVGETVDERTDAIVMTADFSTKDECITAINVLWQRSQRNFIAIGKYLLRAKDKLGHGEYGKMIESELPFNRSLAYMMRSIAEAIEHRRITPDECPTDYATAYRLVSLPPDKLELAREQQLVKPTLRRQEIVEFRKTYLAEPAGEVKAPVSDRAKRTRKAKLLAKLRQLEQDAMQTKSEISALCRELGEPNPYPDVILDLDASAYDVVNDGVDKAA
jgi:hypothetical protein